MGLFEGSRQGIAWKHFSDELGGRFQEPALLGLRGRYLVEVHVDPWTITLDKRAGDKRSDWSATYTRMSAPYVSDDGFGFKLYAQGLFSKLGKLLNLQVREQAVEVGYPEFDRQFIIYANKKSKAQALLGNAKIRQLIQSLMLGNKDSRLQAETGWWNESRAQLYYEEKGTITDVGRLKSILELLTETLNQIREIGPVSSGIDGHSKEEVDRLKEQVARQQISKSILPAEVKKRLLKNLK